MRARRLVAAGLAVACAAVAAGVVLGASAPPQPQTQECKGIRDCLRVEGPWVAVPPRGEVSYLLDCPLRRGVAAGLDALASSRDVRVTFQGLIGSPIQPGVATTRYVLFRALSATGKRGAFKPFLGCIPVNSGGRQTTSVKALGAVPGPPLELAQTSFRVRPGAVRRVTIGCVRKQRLARSWHAIAFRTKQVPQLGLVDAIRVTRKAGRSQVVVTIVASEALPRSARAEVQVGVACAAR